MRNARRDVLISSAQVAYHFGAYTLKDALGLSRSERELLLGVVLAEEERAHNRLEGMLGVSWDLKSLLDLTDTTAKDAKEDAPERLPNRVRIPLALALAPDLLKAMSDDYRRKWRQALMDKLDNVPKGNTVVNVGTLSAEDAKAFWAHINGTNPVPQE